MNQSWALLSEDTVYPQADPRLRLLVELEPGHRVFFRNLADALWPQPEPPLFLASRPIPSRGPFFIRTGLHWTVYVESMVWQLFGTLLLLALFSPRWEIQHHLAQPTERDFSRSHLSYYPQAETFPARAGRQAMETDGREASSHPVIHVAGERRPATVAPPNVEMGGGGRSGLMASHPALPSPPLSATARSRFLLPAGRATVLAPPPALARASSLTFALSQALVAPPPMVKGFSRGLASALTGALVAPAPAVQGLIQMRGSGDIDFGGPAVVAPSPRLGLDRQRSGRRMPGGIPGGGGTAVIAPPPSVAGLPVLASGNGNSLRGTGRVVPPLPLISGMRAGGGGGLLSGAETPVVAPPPAIVGPGVLGGGRIGESLAGGSAVVVRPAPSFGQAHSLGGGMGSSANSGGSLAVAPAPSVGGSGIGAGGGNGRNPLAGPGGRGMSPSGNEEGAGVGGANPLPGAGTGLAGTGAGRVSTAGLKTPDASASAPLAGHSGGAQSQTTPILRSTLPPPSERADDPAGTTRVLPLRVIQLALALPITSYFSNYEAFVAERAVNKEATQLIKLVYVFLPYQRRLTEYGINTKKTFTLRVTRDPSCDESLISMTWPEGETSHGLGQNSDDSNDKLPCYRTTADDYRKALAGAR